MEHSFNIDLATEIGILPAILLKNIYFWIKHNEANNTNFYDGYYWTFNSVQAFGKLFPYVSHKQIRNALKKLEDLGFIKTGNYNKLNYDRTIWYALEARAEAIFLKGQMDFPKRANGFSQKGKPIPDINTNINTDIKNKVCSDNKTKYFDNVELNNTFIDFLDLRKKKKIPNTERAITLLINKINKLSNRNILKAIEIINNSICSGWSSVYPLKENNKNFQNNKNNIFIYENQREYDFDKLEAELLG